MKDNLEDHKHRIGVRLTRRIGHAVESGEITLEELPTVCDTVLLILGAATNASELDSGLHKLLSRYSFFADTIELYETAFYNWRCLECFSLNSPKRDTCRQCGLSRSHTFSDTEPNRATSNNSI